MEPSPESQSLVASLGMQRPPPSPGPPILLGVPHYPHLGPGIGRERSIDQKLKAAVLARDTSAPPEVTVTAHQKGLCPACPAHKACREEGASGVPKVLSQVLRM